MGTKFGLLTSSSSPLSLHNKKSLSNLSEIVRCGNLLLLLELHPPIPPPPPLPPPPPPPLAPPPFPPPPIFGGSRFFGMGMGGERLKKRKGEDTFSSSCSCGISSFPPSSLLPIYFSYTHTPPTFFLHFFYFGKKKMYPTNNTTLVNSLLSSHAEMHTNLHVCNVYIFQLSFLFCMPPLVVGQWTPPQSKRRSWTPLILNLAHFFLILHAREQGRKNSTHFVNSRKFPCCLRTL